MNFSLITAKLIRAFVFATRIVQSLYLFNPKFQAASHLLRLYSRFVWDLVVNPEDRFSQNEAHMAYSGGNLRDCVTYGPY